jgi:hypothetical protein
MLDVCNMTDGHSTFLIQKHYGMHASGQSALLAEVTRLLNVDGRSVLGLNYVGLD